MKSVLLIALPALMLVGCDETANIQAGDNVVSISADGDNSQVSIDTPLFKTKVKLPGEMITNSSFDLDGVKLYPGSNVTGVNVNAGEGQKSAVTIRFDSPASTATVRDYFVKAFADKKMTVTQTATGLSGSDKDSSPFSITLTEEGAAKTAGTIVMQN
jgi:hypothetical protein